jgi:hypothetical protein
MTQAHPGFGTDPRPPDQVRGGARRWILPGLASCTPSSPPHCHCCWIPSRCGHRSSATMSTARRSASCWPPTTEPPGDALRCGRDRLSVVCPNLMRTVRRRHTPLSPRSSRAPARSARRSGTAPPGRTPFR